MNSRQERFCEEFLVDFNATGAAVRAGYSTKTAYSAGQRLLKNVEVKRYIEKRKEEIQAKTSITQEEVVSEISKIAFDDAFRASDRLKALEMLGKYFGMFKDKVETDVKVEFVLPGEVRRYAK